MNDLKIINGETTLNDNHACGIYYKYRSGNTPPVVSVYDVNVPFANSIDWSKVNTTDLFEMSKGQYNDNLFNTEEKKDYELRPNSPQLNINSNLYQILPLFSPTRQIPNTRPNNQPRENPIINQQRAQIPDISYESESDESSEDNLESKQNQIEQGLASLQIGVESGSDKRFWNMIRVIRCYDKDEGLMTEKSIKLPKFKCKEIIRKINYTYMPVLKNKIEQYLNNIEMENRENFMTHIICKGKDFYNIILSDPSICLYLCDKYYPLHTWISDKSAGRLNI